MRVIFSSKYMASELKRLGDDIHNVHAVRMSTNQITVITSGEILDINVHTNIPENSSAHFKQSNVHWNGIMDFCRQIEEQPLHLDLWDNGAQIVMKF